MISSESKLSHTTQRSEIGMTKLLLSCESQNKTCLSHISKDSYLVILLR
nr:MAG TPA: hypothetical protein [Caudoviricetes sp.]